ncbi:MAG: peptidoglycan-binding protein, partial [Ilumatobacteraceae bacterium]
MRNRELDRTGFPNTMHDRPLTNRTGARRVLPIAVASLVLGACSATAISSAPTASTTSPPPTRPTDAPETTSLAAPESTAPTTVASPPLPEVSTTPPPPPPTPAPPATLAPLDVPIEAVGTGDGPATARAQQRLLELGFWVDGTDGEYGITTTQAVMAFQKYHHLDPDGVLGPQTAALLDTVTARPTASADAGTLVEVDKGLQLLFFVIDGRTEWIFNASTGTEIPYEEPDKNTPGEVQRGDSVTRNGLH